MELRSSVSQRSFTFQSYSAPFISGWAEMVPGKTKMHFGSPSLLAFPDVGLIMQGVNLGKQEYGM